MIYCYDLDENNNLNISLIKGPSRKDKLNKLGIVQLDYFAKSNIVDTIINFLDYNLPIVVREDLFFDEDSTYYYKKIHWAHYLLIYGYDIKRKVFLVFDSIDGTNHRYIFKEKPFAMISETYMGFLNYFSNNNTKPSFMVFKNSVSEGLSREYVHSTVKQKTHNNTLKICNNSANIIKFLDNILTLIYEDLIHKQLDSIIAQLNHLCLSKTGIHYLQSIPSFYNFQSVEQTEINNFLLDLYFKIRVLLLKYYYSGVLSSQIKISLINYLKEIKQKELVFSRNELDFIKNIIYM